MITINIPGTPLAMFIVLTVIFLAAMGANRLCEAGIAFARMYFEPEPEPFYDVEPEPQPQPEVQVVQVLPAQRAVDLLPPAPPSLAEVPLFASIPFTLPMSVPDASFDFWGPRWLAPTGALPIVEPTPNARQRFSTPKPGAKPKPRQRKVTVQVGDETRGELLEVGA